MQTNVPDPPQQDQRSDGRQQRRRRRSFSLIPALLCFPLGVLAAAGMRFAIESVFVYYPWLRETYSPFRAVFPADALPPIFLGLAVVCGACAAISLLASLLGLFRRRWTLWTLRKGYVAAYAGLVFYGYVVLNVTGQIERSNVDFAEGEVDPIKAFFWRWDYLWPAGCLLVMLVILHVLSWRRAVINLYTGADEPSPAAGDQIIENVRTHGRDPQFRKSLLSSMVMHLLVIVIIPWLLQLYGCVRPYRVPWGSGKPAVAMVKLVKPKKKKKKRKKYILRSDSAIIFEIPDLDDSNLLEEVEEATELTYKADPNAAQGAMGTGGGNKPGWADGFLDGEVRFIRLEHGGPNWDDGMDSLTRADMNFLDEFKRLSGGLKTAKHSEAHPIRLLRKYPKGQAPPFVYITGSAHIPISQYDLKILREYLLDGGMLVGDCGSPRFDGHFRGLARALFPGSPLLPIADDDPIFQIPYTFSHGAPPLWHHGGLHAMGIKHKGRWVVFYHPGDLNDAWKSGHSGLDPSLARGAFQMGTNIVYYAFTHYLQETRKYRK